MRLNQGGQASSLHRVLLILAMVAALIPVRAAQYMREIHVNADGSGDFTTITESLEAIRAYMDYPVTVYIANGVYNEKVVIPSWLQNVTFIGESADSTIIRWSDHANIYKTIPTWTETVVYDPESGQEAVVTADSTQPVGKMGTFRTYTVRIDGSDITMRNLTIENDAPQLGQAVALHTEGDRLRFEGCRFLGNQDTIFTGRPYTKLIFEDCYVEGTTDFIFGAATAYFKDCEIVCKRDSYITAASTPQDVAYGYVFDNCHVTALDGVQRMYLGRPWRPYAYTMWINCRMDAPICADRWHNWSDPANEQTARYGEYGSTGAYGDSSQAVPWAKTLNADEVQQALSAVKW